MIDSHVHLNHPDFGQELDDIIVHAQNAGVTGMVNIGFDLESSLETVSMTERFAWLYGAVGVHPHDSKTYNEQIEKELEKLLDKPRVVAVGEIGLDFYRDLTPRDKQREVFGRQLLMARRKNMPVVIHCRDAFSDTIALLREMGGPFDGIFHAFTGDEAMAKEVMELGFHIGIGGVVTFRNSNLADVVATLPAEAIVLETDCPYLTPVPFRGKRNEPSYLTYIVDKISAVRNEPAAGIMEQTNRNVARALCLEH